MYTRKKVYYKNRTRGPNWLIAQAQNGSMTKYYDQTSTASITLATNTWTFALNDGAAIDGLFYPLRGVQINQREGRRAMVTKIKCTFLVFTDDDNANLQKLGGRSVRFALIQDTQANGVAAAPSDPWTADNALAFQTLTKMGRFRVLKEKTVWIENDGLILDTTYKQARALKMIKMTYTPKSPIRVNFNETSTESVGSIVDNNFFVVACTPRDEVHILEGRARVSFKDI